MLRDLLSSGSVVGAEDKPSRWREGPLSFLVVALIGLVVASFAWIVAWSTANPDASGASCPGDASDGARVVSRQSLPDVPAKLADSQIRVFNANGERGQATAIAAEFREIGFAAPPDNASGNDPLNPDQDLACNGQLRFGDNGRWAALAVVMALPCVELVNDGREDATTDLALGTFFSGLSHKDTNEEVLAQLREGKPANAATVTSIRSMPC